MGLWSVVGGEDPALLAAEERLRDTENLVFEMLPGEDTDLAIHARADRSRFRTIYQRQTVDSLTASRDRKRNFALLLLTFGLLAAKSFGLLDVAWKLLSAM